MESVIWFGVSLAASAAWLAILTASLCGTAIWPPRTGSWLAALWAWGLTILIYVGLIRSGAADWNALGWPAWFRWGVGGAALTLVSFWIQGRGIADLGLKGTSGWDVGLVRSGAYARRRHPQYLGQAVSLVGLALLAASPLALIAGAVGAVALVWASVVEDRVLARRHGDAHAAYRREVRFF